MGKPRNTQKYTTYPEIPEIPGNTRKKKRYPEIPDLIFRHSCLTRTRPATRYFVQYPTRPDTEKPYPLGTGHEMHLGVLCLWLQWGLKLELSNIILHKTMQFQLLLWTILPPGKMRDFENI